MTKYKKIENVLVSREFYMGKAWFTTEAQRHREFLATKNAKGANVFGPQMNANGREYFSNTRSPDAATRNPGSFRLEPNPDYAALHPGYLLR
jgi:hypothetical protein